MDQQNPRYSTSEKLLKIALDHSKSDLNCETILIRLNDLKFRSLRGLLL